MKRRLNALTGLKVVAVIAVFLWHSPLAKEGWPDIGARSCELLFVVSGFLVAYNRFGSDWGRAGDIFSYVFNKVRRLYPVYLFSVLLSIGALVVSNRGLSLLTAEMASALPFHLLLMQAWASGMAMLYNGAAWFLSALLFCYLAAPFLSAGLRTLSDRMGMARACTILLLSISALRLLIEFGARANPQVFSISIHTFPLVRVLEFSMGYVAGAYFQERIDRISQKSSLLSFSALELVSVAIALGCIVLFGQVWMRGFFVLLFIPVVCIFAVGRGVLSRALSVAVLISASKIEMEFYLLHQPIIRLLAACLALFGIAWQKKAAVIALLLAVGASAACRYVREVVNRRRAVRL